MGGGKDTFKWYNELALSLNRGIELSAVERRNLKVRVITGVEFSGESVKPRV